MTIILSKDSLSQVKLFVARGQCMFFNFNITQFVHKAIYAILGLS